ncbi:MAG: ribose-phosphate pyrophosphokinase [Candidatus Nomurabacteria bacterium]|jgi:ribose-phosphate pyrophosphokinase|nr:ribose-phosphate pyrophosphokinase [Candidatus Nomurabacteria bacterium]
MLNYNKPILVSGSTYPELAERVVGYYPDIVLDDTERRQFPGGETYVDIKTALNRQDVYILQTFRNKQNGLSLNDQVVEAELLASAALDSGAGYITSIFPYYPYSRQDRKTRGGEPISGKTTANKQKACGVSRIATMDLHASQEQGFLDGAFNNQKMHPFIQEYLKQKIGENAAEFTIIAPDTGGAERAKNTANALKTDMEYMPKSRDKDDSSKLTRDEKFTDERKIYGKNCVVIDDIIDTAGTLVTAADILHKIGAKSIIACATHGLFSDPAIERIKNSQLSEIVITNTLPQAGIQEQLGDQIKVIDISRAIGEYIMRVNRGGEFVRDVPEFIVRNHGIELI